MTLLSCQQQYDKSFIMVVYVLVTCSGATGDEYIKNPPYAEAPLRGILLAHIAHKLPTMRKILPRFRLFSNGQRRAIENAEIP